MLASHFPPALRMRLAAAPVWSTRNTLSRNTVCTSSCSATRRLSKSSKYRSSQKNRLGSYGVTGQNFGADAYGPAGPNQTGATAPY